LAGSREINFTHFARAEQKNFRVSIESSVERRDMIAVADDCKTRLRMRGLFIGRNIIGIRSNDLILRYRPRGFVAAEAHSHYQN
jgi:hypothetical protein